MLVAWTSPTENATNASVRPSAAIAQSWNSVAWKKATREWYHHAASIAVSIGVSVGMAPLDRATESGEEALLQADRRLYARKHQRRGRQPVATVAEVPIA